MSHPYHLVYALMANIGAAREALTGKKSLETQIAEQKKEERYVSGSQIKGGYTKPSYVRLSDDEYAAQVGVAQQTLNQVIDQKSKLEKEMAELES